MYTSKIRRQWDTQASREVQDTTYGFYNIFDFNLSMGFDTKVYGFWKPMKFLGDKVEDDPARPYPDSIVQLATRLRDAGMGNL